MKHRDTPAAALMRAAQDTPDRPQARIQLWLDGATILTIDRLGLAAMPVMSRAHWLRAAVREKIERDRGAA